MNQLGYWQGVRQPALQIALAFPENSEVDLSALDHWLVESLGMELEDAPQSNNVSPADVSIVSLAWRVLQVARHLQQEARIPVFAAGRITQIRPSPKTPATRIVIALVPCLDMISRQATSIAHNAALKLVNWAFTHWYGQTDIEDLYKTIDSDAIRPLGAISLSGLSTLPILKEAFQQNIPYRHLGAGVYQLGWGANSRLLDRSVLDTDSAIGSRISNKKHWTTQFLHSAGFPTPENVLVNSLDEAKTAARRLGWPLVVKPADRERSEGVTISIRDEERLQQAYQHAATLSKLILVEREVPGLCYRLMVANGDFLYAVRRRPKSVTGDGQARVAQLMERAQTETQKLPPWRRGKPIKADALCAEALEAQGMTLDDVPGPGARVGLRLIESTEWGGDVEDATGEVHTENKDLAVRAAHLFGLGNAGIDIITPDISIPWHVNGAIMNEVNFAPHFGGTSTAKAKMPTFLRHLIKGNGRIPVEACIGASEAMEAGRQRQAALLVDGIHCYLTSHQETLDRHGNAMSIACQGLFERTLALLMNRDVEALILVLQTDELLHTGVPVDSFARISRTEGKIVRHSHPGEYAEQPVMTRLFNLLQAHINKDSSNADRPR